MNVELSILIPALNAEKSLPAVLSKIPKEVLPPFELIIVDNGSNDWTCKTATEMGAIVVRETKRGYGCALRRGIEKAKGHIVVTMDSDGAHNPEDIPKLMKPILEDGRDLVLGSRIHSRPSGMKFTRYLGNLLLGFLFKTLYHEPLSDTQCGFRAIRREALRELTLTEEGMQLTTELLLESIKKKLNIAVVDIEEQPTETSCVRPVQDFLLHVLLMLRKKAKRRNG